ncbi:MAG: hypothetical protein R3199_08445 [Gemmatimonadota bacterium]|nr:hypothetical protein [Gemmatimonadota bacterium]
MGRTKALVALALLVALAAACEEENPFRNQPAIVTSGMDRVWELDLDGFPSGFDFTTGTRFFVGTTEPRTSSGSWVLAARADGTLVFRAFSTLAPRLSLVRTGIQDLTERQGVRSFEAVTEVPGDGYSASDDSTGVAVVEGHVYAFQIRRIRPGFAPINFAKLEVVSVEREFPDDPRSRSVRFRWAYQTQPLNRNVTVEESP